MTPSCGARAPVASPQERVTRSAAATCTPARTRRLGLVPPNRHRGPPPHLVERFPPMARLPADLAPAWPEGTQSRQRPAEGLPRATGVRPVADRRPARRAEGVQPGGVV